MHAIVITGGPCAGKTSVLGELKAALERRGWTLVCSPECATTVISTGIAPWTVPLIDFQRAVFDLQFAQEEILRTASRRLASDRVVLVFDRGLIDGRAYLTDQEFNTILEERGLRMADVLARYDAVFHLESAAKGAQGAYTLATNATRKEDPTEAVRLDNRTIEVWSQHPKHCVIQNEELFEQKAAHLIEEVCAVLT